MTATKRKPAARKASAKKPAAAPGAPVPLAVAPFSSDAERKRVYGALFYGSQDGARVLADILQSNGVFSPSFTGRFDPVPAAHADGMKAAALSIFALAGGREGRLARALVLNDAKETRHDATD